MGNFTSKFLCWEDDSQDEVLKEKRVGDSPRDPMYYLESPRIKKKPVEILPTIFEEQ